MNTGRFLSLANMAVAVMGIASSLADQNILAAAWAGVALLGWANNFLLEGKRK